MNTHSIGINAGGASNVGTNVSTSICNSGAEECRNARNVTIADNLLIGVASQNISSVNGQNIVIEHNKMIKPGQVGSGVGSVPIDIEANVSTDRNRNIIIKGNLINAVGSPNVLNGIVVQNGAGTSDFGPIIVDSNSVIGAQMSNTGNYIIHAHIYVAGASNTRVTNNKLIRGYNCLDAEGATNSLFEGNEITSCGFGNTAPIYVQSSSGNVFRHNTITIDSTDSLAAGENRNIIEDGTSTNNLYDGNLADLVSLAGASKSASRTTSGGTFVFDAAAGTPPFAVTANTTVVTNLDADKLDGQHGSYYQNASNLNSGTVAPARLGTGTANSTTFLRGDGSWATPSGAGSQWTSTSSGDIYYNSGKVGIGTTPSYKLHVYDSGNVFATFESATAAAQFSLISNATGAGSWSLGTGWSSGGSTRNLYFYDNVASANRMVLDGSGNLGIGTTSPNTKLHITGGDAYIATQGNGVILKATNGANCYRLTVDNAGALSTTAVTCP